MQIYLISREEKSLKALEQIGLNIGEKTVGRQLVL